MAMTPTKLKEKRISLGLTQAQAAKSAFVTLRHWQRIEGGEVNSESDSYKARVQLFLNANERKDAQ